MDRFCVICGRELIGMQRVLCSDKECHKEWKKSYNCNYCQEHMEEKKEYDHEYYQRNQEDIKKHSREYYYDNLEKERERNHEYRQNNREKKNASGRIYYHNNREKSLEYSKEYRQNNSEKINERDRKKYRRDRGLSEDVDLHKESSLERIMREWLQKNNIEFIAQYYVNLENSTWTYVDFFIEPNICLYCDGNYYHSLLDAKKCDENQNRILPQMGYNVIRLSETEILSGIRPDLILAD